MQLTPGFFDAFVLIVVAVGLVRAVFQIRHDFRRGPRFKEDGSLIDPPKARKSRKES